MTGPVQIGTANLPGDALQGVGRAFAVLEHLAERPQTPSELARALDMKWTTAYRTLMTLTAMGYVERNADTGCYSVGVRTYAVGSAYVSALKLPEIASPYLSAAAELAGSTTQLVTRDDHSSVVVSVCPVRSHVMPETSVGCNFPLHCGSKGHVLLAYADPAFRENYLSGPLVSLTPLSITDPDILRERLDQVRARGYAVTDRDVRMFSSSVAAPIVDRAGDVVASVTIAMDPHELRQQTRRLIDLVVRTARGISQRLISANNASPPGTSPESQAEAPQIRLA
jgi:DNA-binding IclR family transcriptional regulator